MTIIDTRRFSTMDPKLKGGLLGAVIGTLVGLGLFGLCSWNVIVGAVLGGIPGAIFGVAWVVGSAVREKEIETGLGS
jgi:hypothetical protein